MEARSLPKHAVSAIFYSQVAYWSSLAGAILSLMAIPPGSVRTFVILVPMLTGILCAAVAYWLYEACDEYVRIKLNRSVAITALVIALGSLGYFCLELLGYPRQSMLWVSILGWSVFNLQLLIVIINASRGHDAGSINFRAANS